MKRTFLTKRTRKLITVSFIAVIFIVAVFLVFVFAENPDISQAMVKARERFGNPEIAVVIMNSDGILFQEAQGVHRADRNEQATLDDRFHLGSNAKAMLSFVAAKLVEENVISWETKFFDVVPELKADARRAYDNITLESLFSHRARVMQLASADIAEVPEELWSDSRDDINVELITWALKREPVSLEDRTHAYSNTGYMMAALMLERVTNRDWKDLLRLHLYENLGFDIQFGWPNETDEHQPWGHEFDPETSEFIPLYREMEGAIFLPRDFSPAGDVNMSVLEYARWVQMHLRGLRGDAEYISRESYHYLHFGLEKYALGWGNVEFDEHNHLSFHDGSDHTFKARAIILPESDLAFVLLTNVRDQGGFDDLTDRILKKYDKMRWLLSYMFV